jgi:hypothetical protein
VTLVSWESSCILGQTVSPASTDIGAVANITNKTLINDEEIIAIICSMSAKSKQPFVNRLCGWRHPLINNIYSNQSLAFVDCGVARVFSIVVKGSYSGSWQNRLIRLDLRPLFPSVCVDGYCRANRSNVRHALTAEVWTVLLVCGRRLLIRSI